MYPLPPQVNTALTLLNQAGFEAFVVGGAVRDLLRSSPVHDWDITTSALPEQTKVVFEHYRLIETGIKHGTVTVLLDGMPLEITTYRTESTYSDHRRPDSVSFTRSLEEDLARRDFTINAIAYHPDLGVIDPFGGKADLDARVIRCVGEPDKRFQEDALRILRGLRFAARFGFSIEPNTAAAIHRNKELLTHIAAERIREELTGLLLGSCIDPVLRQYHDVLSVPIPELAPLAGFQQHNRHHCHDIWGHTIAAVTSIPNQSALRWAALLHDTGKPARFTRDEKGVGHFYGHAAESAKIAAAVTARLRFDNATRDQICFLVEHHHLFADVSEKSVKRAVQQFGHAQLRLLLWMFRADTLAKSPFCLDRLDSIRALAALIDAQPPRLTPRELDLSGTDLLALGFRGAQIGQALDKLVHAVVFEGLENKKDALLAYLSEHS